MHNFTSYLVTHYLLTDGEFVTPDEDGLGGDGEEAGGWDVDDDLELPPDLVIQANFFIFHSLLE